MNRFKSNDIVLSATIYTIIEFVSHHTNDTKRNVKENLSVRGKKLFKMFRNKHFDGLRIREPIASSEGGNNCCGVLS